MKAENQSLDYTLLSDSKLRAASAFGIAFRLDEATLARYKGHGLDLQASTGETHNALPVPAVFVIGTDGVITYAHANPDFKVRLEPDVILEAAKAGL